MNKGMRLSGHATSFFALTDLLYNSLILAVRERTECINRIAFKLQLNNKIERRDIRLCQRSLEVAFAVP